MTSTIVSEVVITETPAPEPIAKSDDAAFAHGEAVGEFRSHMSECSMKHLAHDSAEASLEARLSAVESQANAASTQAIVATVQAAEAQETADEAVEEVEDEDASEVEVVEMEMPDIPTESTEEPKKSGGFHLW